LNFFTVKHLIFCFIVLCSFCFHGCATLSDKEHLMPFDQQYIIHSLGKGWEVLQEEREGFSLWNEKYPATIVIIYSPLNNEKQTSDILNHQLFIGIGNKNVLLKEPSSIDGKEAMHSLLQGELDDKKFKFDSYIIKGNDFVCDIVYFAPPDLFDSAHNDFRELIKTFHFLR